MHILLFLYLFICGVYVYGGENEGDFTVTIPGLSEKNLKELSPEELENLLTLLMLQESSEPIFNPSSNNQTLSEQPSTAPEVFQPESVTLEPAPTDNTQTEALISHTDRDQIILADLNEFIQNLSIYSTYNLDTHQYELNRDFYDWLRNKPNPLALAYQIICFMRDAKNNPALQANTDDPYTKIVMNLEINHSIYEFLFFLHIHDTIWKAIDPNNLSFNQASMIDNLNDFLKAAQIFAATIEKYFEVSIQPAIYVLRGLSIFKARTPGTFNNLLDQDIIDVLCICFSTKEKNEALNMTTEAIQAVIAAPYCAIPHTTTPYPVFQKGYNHTTAARNTWTPDDNGHWQPTTRNDYNPNSEKDWDLQEAIRRSLVETDGIQLPSDSDSNSDSDTKDKNTKKEEPIEDYDDDEEMGYIPGHGRHRLPRPNLNAFNQPFQTTYYTDTRGGNNNTFIEIIGDNIDVNKEAHLTTQEITQYTANFWDFAENQRVSYLLSLGQQLGEKVLASLKEALGDETYNTLLNEFNRRLQNLKSNQSYRRRGGISE